MLLVVSAEFLVGAVSAVILAVDRAQGVALQSDMCNDLCSPLSLLITALLM